MCHVSSTGVQCAGLAMNHVWASADASVFHMACVHVPVIMLLTESNTAVIAGAAAGGVVVIILVILIIILVRR